MREELIEFRLNASLEITDGEYPVPLTFACVVARHQQKVLCIFNSWRGEWELPAGSLEPGETPELAAVRELMEESGQFVSQLHYVGLCLLRLANGQPELGALYTGEVDMPQPFVENPESDKIMWWDGQAEVEGDMNALVPQLIALADLRDK
ncbi:MAG: NUDIX hydrolase [Anaerolineae bacterium]|nr:NUDIX hydrolase [Anaerolineae bacterium]